MWANPRFPAVSFAEEILNGRPHFLWSAKIVSQDFIKVIKSSGYYHDHFYDTL